MLYEDEDEEEEEEEEDYDLVGNVGYPFVIAFSLSWWCEVGWGKVQELKIS